MCRSPKYWWKVYAPSQSNNFITKDFRQLYGTPPARIWTGRFLTYAGPIPDDKAPPAPVPSNAASIRPSTTPTATSAGAAEESQEATMTTGLAAYCICGAQMTANGNDKLARSVIAEWRTWHQGEGHGETDARTCRNARRRAEAQDERDRWAEYRKEKNA